MEDPAQSANTGATTPVASGRRQRAAVTRRAMLGRILHVGTAVALTSCTPKNKTTAKSHSDPPLETPVDLVRFENARAGTTEWLLTNPKTYWKGKSRCPWVEGYCSKSSVRAGEELVFFVSTNSPVSQFTIDIYRSGYYGGTGGRLMKSLGPFPGKTQPDPAIGVKRLRECRWVPSLALRIPQDWLSGVYLAKLTAIPTGIQSYVIFIVRDDRPADFIFKCSDTTWQAYNRWPHHFSLYDDGHSRQYWGPHVEVSFDRPYSKSKVINAPLSLGSGEWLLWEFPMAYWLESQGYDVTYISSWDLHRDALEQCRARALLSVGHDEYYTLEMFRNLRLAISQGLSVGFFSGNTCCGRVGVRAASHGQRDRIMTRLDRFGPIDPREVHYYPERAQLPWSSPNENMLVGARNISPMVGGADWICDKPDHWIFAGTGMDKGEGISGLVGWEWLGDPAPIPGLEVVATGPTWSPRGSGTYTATVYPGPRGNVVFNASTCWWGDALAEPPGYVRPSIYVTPPGPDEQAQQITANVLNRMRQGQLSVLKGLG